MNHKDLSIGYAKGLKERFQERGFDLSYDDIQKAYFLGYDTALKNMESSSRIISSPQLDLKIVAERNKRYPRMEHGGFDSTLNEARREAFIEGAKYVKQVDY